MIKILSETEDKFISVKASGKLTKEDYDKVITLAEEKIKTFGKTNWLIEIEDFKGWEFKAALEDLKFDLKHYNDVEKIAMLGESTWEKYAANLSTIFTGGEVKFFHRSNREAAINWARK